MGCCEVWEAQKAGLEEAPPWRRRKGWLALAAAWGRTTLTAEEKEVASVIARFSQAAEALREPISCPAAPL